jgi:adenylate cyclase
MQPASSPPPEIRFFALGPAVLKGPGDAETASFLQRPKLVALFTYLAAATPHGLQRRDALLGLLWADLDQERARAALRQSLYYLRQFLGEGAVATRGDEEVGLAPERVWCDVTAFEEALEQGAREAALDLYRGDLLEGLLLPGALEFARWLEQRREALRRRAREAAWELAREAHAAANVAAAAHWTRQALRLARDDEGLLRQAIALLDRIGDHAGAVREYDAFAQRLREDLNIEPAPETRALVDEVRGRAQLGGTPRARGSGNVVREPPATSVAVLPFLNMSPDPGNEYLSDGIAEEITNALTKVKALQVASRTSAFAFKGRGVDVRRIGEELEVATVLEGSVRKAGTRLRITAQLVKAATGYHLWSERYDREADDVFAIQDEIARNVAAALKVLLTDEQQRGIVQVPTAHIQAYEYYLRGRFFLHRFQKHAVRHARDMFERAIAIDADYALAHAGIADSSSFLYMYFDGSPANLALADQASRRVLELNPGLAEGHAARGLAVALDNRFEEAEREFEQAITLDPTSFEPQYFYARTCFQQGKLERAVGLFERACTIRDDYQARLLAALALQGLGREVEARAGYERALEVIERHHAVQPGDARALTLGAACLARLGRDAEAIDWRRRALDIDPEDPVVIYAAACTDAILGRRAEALDGLERALARGFGNRRWVRNDPDFASLRDNPRFQALVERS